MDDNAASLGKHLYLYKEQNKKEKEKKNLNKINMC